VLTKFTGLEYLKIDIASNFGLDKEDWDIRLDWFEQNKNQLHSLVPKAETPALFYAGILAWEKAVVGEASGYPISLDATCSGIQILSALACDRKAAELCNVVDTGHREDAYTAIYDRMVATTGSNQMMADYPLLQKKEGAAFIPVKRQIDRKLVKSAIMTAFYGSTAQPKKIFGDGDLLNLFYKVVEENAPGAWEINQAMLKIWDPDATIHEWVLPDNFHVKVKVMGQIVDVVNYLNELYEIVYSENMPLKEGRSLGANMVHSIDGMIVREMLRRCHYDSKKIATLSTLANVGCCGRSKKREQDHMVVKLWDHYQKTKFLSARILDYLDMDNMGLTNPLIIKNLIDSLPKKSFEIITIHDCFRCLPNYGNDLRQQYNNLLAEIAESNLLSSIMSQMTGRTIVINKLDPSMVQDIYDTNYALS
jgi:hypothetical protein